METELFNNVIGLGAVGISALTLLVVAWTLRRKKSDGELFHQLVEVIKAMQKTHEKVADAIHSQRASIEANTMTVASLSSSINDNTRVTAEKLETVTVNLQQGLARTSDEFAKQGESLVKEMRQASEALRKTLVDTERKLDMANTRFDDLLTTTAPLSDAAQKLIASVGQLREINETNNRQLGRLEALEGRLEVLTKKNGLHHNEEEIENAT
jgi:methyl-accepting chemotaxis protein